MKLTSLFLPVLTAVASNCFGAIVTVDGAGIRGLWDVDSGTLLRAGSNIWVGYFSGLTDAAVIANQHNASLLQSSFISFGLGGAIGDGVGGAAGYFTFDTTATLEGASPTFTVPSVPNNKQVYVWAFDSSIAPSFATHQAIFTSSAPSWTWPSNDDGSTDRMISPDDNLSMLVGSADSNGVYLHAMPEPGSCSMLVMGFVGLLSMRHRSRRSRLPA